MQKGRLVARGFTSEIYEYGTDHVIKLFHEKYGLDEVERESTFTQLVYDLGAPSAGTGGIVKDGNRWGIILEHIEGPTMTNILGPKPWKIRSYAKLFSEVHAKIHTITSDAFPNQKAVLREHIITSRGRLGRQNADLILERLESLPEMQQLCHNDMHQENIIYATRGPVVIDWSNVQSGNPAADVVNVLLIQERAQPLLGKMNASKLYLKFHNLYRRWFASLYLKEYIKRTGVTKAEVEAWFLPVAASRLVSQTRKEKDWTEKFILDRLKKEGLF